MQALPVVDTPATLQSLGEAMLIGLIIGVQRELSGGAHAGLRDFLLIGLAGGVCGLVQNSWLTAASLLSIAVLLAVYDINLGQVRTGVTTEMAAVATFCLTYLTTMPNYPIGAPLAIGTAILVVVFLETKQGLQKLLRETITEEELNGTLRFLAVVLVIYPLLPTGHY